MRDASLAFAFASLGLGKVHAVSLKVSAFFRGKSSHVLEGLNNQLHRAETQKQTIGTITCGASRTGSTVGAGNNFNPSVSNGRDVAFDLTLTASFSIQLSTCFDRTNYDSIIAVFDATTRREIAFNDDANGACALKSLLTLTLDAVS